MKRHTLAKIFASVEQGPAKQPTREELILEFTSRDVNRPRSIVERIAQREYRKQRSYGRRFISVDDIRGELTVDLIRLIDRYVEGRSDSLEAYLAQHLGWRAVDAVGKSQVIRDRNDHDPFVNDHGQEAISSADSGGRQRGRDGEMYSIPVRRDSSEGLDVDGLVSRLEGSSRLVIETYLAMLAESELSGSDEPTESELSKAVGVSQATVSRAFKKIRALVNKTGKTT